MASCQALSWSKEANPIPWYRYIPCWTTSSNSPNGGDSTIESPWWQTSKITPLAQTDWFNRDPELTNLCKVHRTWIMQCLYVCTGCDYVSFFAGIGKTSFLKVFFEKAFFIVGEHSTALSSSNFHEISFLVFVRLIGMVYFKRHKRAFNEATAESHFFSHSNLPPQTQHEEWLNNIRQAIWDRISFEDEMIPSLEVLQRHWLQSSWVLHV